MLAVTDRRPSADSYFIDYVLVIALQSGKRPALSGGTRPAPDDQEPEYAVPGMLLTLVTGVPPKAITRQLAGGPLRRRWLIDYALVNQFSYLFRVTLAGKRPALV